MNLQWTRNPELEGELYARMRRKYVQDRTKELHFSDTLYCLTKAYWNKTDPIPVDDQALGYFAIGFALEEVVLKTPPTVNQINTEIHSFANNSDMVAQAIHDLYTKSGVQPYMYEGLHFSPDYTMTSQDGEMDLKSTRMGMDDDGRPKRVTDRPHGFPDSWLKQFMGYAHRIGASPADPPFAPVDYVDYGVAIMYLIPAKLIAGTIRFDWDDVELNMAQHLHRASIIEDQLSQGVPPVPFMYNEQWECKNCPYLSRCQAYKA